MKNFIIGTLIYSNGNIKVTKHELGYTVTNGEKTQVTTTMPCLNTASLSQLLGVKKTSLLKQQMEGRAFRNGLSKIVRIIELGVQRESELLEMHSIGY